MDIVGVFKSYSAIGLAFYYLWWIILPVAFFYIFKFVWKDFIIDKSKFSWLKNLNWIVLEIIPPREIEKGPQIMEPIFWAMSGVLTSYNTFDIFLRGAFTHHFMLELVGEEGKAHFYIRTQKQYQNLVEAQIYAQYPDAEVREVPDYVNNFPNTIPNKDWDLWGTTFEFVMPDAYPMKTYEKFEEDVTGRMIDPVSGLVEVINSLGPGQHIWLQYNIEPLPETWKKDEMKLVQKLAGREVGEKKGFFGHLADVFANLPKGVLGAVEFPDAAKINEQPLEFRLTPGEKEVLKAVEANLGLNHFKTRITFIYLGKKESFHKSYVSSFIGAFKQFNDLNLNNYRPNDRSKTYAHFLFKEERLAFRKRLIYRRYKNRNWDGKKIILSNRELATMFHLPDMEVKSPSVMRVDSKRGTAPGNLPI